MVADRGEFGGSGSAGSVSRSTGRTGSALDNAVAEAFNSTLELEVLSGQHFTTRAQARTAVAAFLDEYNTTRRHSSAGGLAPVAYELAMAAAAPANPSIAANQHQPAAA